VSDFIVKLFGNVEDFRTQAYSAWVYWNSYCIALC